MKAYSLQQIVQSGGAILLFLICLSVYSLAVIWERWNFFRRSSKEQASFLDKIRGFLGKKDLPSALSQCRNQKSAASEVLISALVGASHKEDRRRSCDRALGRHISSMEKRIGALGTIGSIAPFVGLFGTVLGVMRAFRDLAGTAGAGPGVVAVGISEALVTTAAGLFVAIPAIVGYNVFLSKIERLANELRWVSEEILEQLSEKPGAL